MVSVHSKCIKLGQMTNLDVIFLGGVHLSIGENLKLASVPCAIPDWPIGASYFRCDKQEISEICEVNRLRCDPNHLQNDSKRHRDPGKCYDYVIANTAFGFPMEIPSALEDKIRIPARQCNIIYM